MRYQILGQKDYNFARSNNFMNITINTNFKAIKYFKKDMGICCAAENELGPLSDLDPEQNLLEQVNRFNGTEMERRSR